MLKLFSGASLLAFAATVAVTPSSALAQTSANQVGEVVVTAQRREQSLQKVPVAVTALTSETLEKSHTTNTIDLPLIAPGLTITQSSSGSQPFIRGVGVQFAAIGTEGSVATYIDGVYMPSLYSSIFSFNNVERIEVLRGPQGTLFGRNTTGGLIQVITRKPTDEPTASVSATAENYSTFTGNFYGSTRLTENVAANLALFARHQGDGYGQNLTLHQDIDYNNEYAARAQVLARPTDSLSVLIAGDYDHSSNDYGVQRNLYGNSHNVLGGTRVGSPYDVTANVPRLVPSKQWGIAQTVSLDMKWATLKSITAYRNWLLVADYDQDMTPSAIVDVHQVLGNRSLQQEFLLQGQTGALNWTGGFFYLWSRANSHPTRTFNAAGGATNFDRYAVQDLQSYAAYVQATYAVTEKLNLTGGFRYTEDKRVLNGFFVALPGNPAPAGTVIARATDLQQSVSKPSWKIGADYQVADGAMVYVTASRGFKAGSYNLSAITDDPVRPETLTAIEGGFKTDLLDRRLRFNGAFYDYDYKDIQLSQTLANGGVKVLNAARGKQRGAEFEVTAVPPVSVGHLEITGNLALLHAKYTSFPGAPITLPNPVTVVPAGVTCPAVRPTTATGNLSCSGDASGARMIRSPKWTGAVAATYTVPVGSGELEISGNYFHSDGFFWEPSNRTRQEPYSVFNGEIAYSPEGAMWRVRAFGRNLGNEVYYLSLGEQAVGDAATTFPPRTYGVGVDLKFGAR